MRECFDKSSQCGIMGHEKKRPPKIKRKRKNHNSKNQNHSKRTGRLQILSEPGL